MNKQITNLEIANWLSNPISINHSYVSINANRNGLAIRSFEIIDKLEPEYYSTQYIKEVTFIDCTFSSDQSLKNNTNLKFENCHFINILKLESKISSELFSNTCRAKILHLYKTTESKFNIGEIESKFLKIEESNIQLISGLNLAQIKEIEILDSYFQNITLSNSIVDYFKINNFSNEKRLSRIHITNSQIKFLGLKGNRNFDSLQIVDSNINTLEIIDQSTYFNSISILKQDLNANHQINILKIKANCINKLYLGSYSFLNLSLYSTLNEKSIININNCEIKNNLEFQSFTNKGNIYLRDLISESNSRLIINNSDLGKTDFLLCDFKKSYLEFNNSKILEIFAASSTFPTKIESRKKTEYHQARLAFGQLISVYKRQGDSVSETAYKSREIEFYYKQLITNFKFSNTPTIIALTLNLVSNNFERWWLLGIAFTGLCGLLFYTLILNSICNFSFHLGIYFEKEYLIGLLKFLNPIRYFDTELLFETKNIENKICILPRGYIFDFLGRIILAYGYYQTIQAFRRFGKK